MAASLQRDSYLQGWCFGFRSGGKRFCSLQEVQSNHFTDFLSPELQKHGYTAIYKKKTTEMYTGNKYAIDGCATFFRRDRFALVKKYEVGFVYKKRHNALGKANSAPRRGLALRLADV